MRESVRSLQIYLMLAGALGLLSNIAQLVQNIQVPVAVVVNLVFAGFCVSLLFCGARLKMLLTTNSRAVVTVLHTGIGLNLALIALLVSGGAEPVSIVRPMLGVLLLLYLRANTFRLAAEEGAQVASAAA